MEKICYTNVAGMKIEGIEGDYVFETIKDKSNFYEYEILNKWKKYLGEYKIIFDVGANLGNHTLFWAKKLNADRIYSFEPYKPNFERLIHNIQNNLLDNVYPINKAVGEKEGFTSVKEFHEDNYGGTTLNGEIQSEGEIEVISIDSFVRETNLENVDFIKIDTEGYEVSVLDGAVKTILKYQPDLWIEVSHQSFQEVRNKLESFGYLVADVIGFNMLFLNRRRHTDIKQVDIGVVLEAMFNNLERVNLYYKNYLTAKSWNEDKNKKLQLAQAKNQELNKKLQLAQVQNRELNEKLSNSNEKYKMALNNHEIVKQQLQLANTRGKELSEELAKSNKKYRKALENYNSVKNQIEEKQRAIKEIGEKEKKFELEAVKCLEDYDLMIVRTEQLLKRITKLETQNSILILENSEQKRKLDIIRNSRIGKMGIKVYQTYKKLRGRQ